MLRLPGFARRVPALRQISPTGCGETVLEMILRYHGQNPGRMRIRAALHANGAGVNIGQLADAARHFGLIARGVEADVDDLRNLPLPAILHWRPGHFVVLERHAGDELQIVDPAVGRKRLPRAAAVAMTSGVALVFERDTSSRPTRAAADSPSPSRAASSAVATRSAIVLAGLLLVPVLLARSMDLLVRGDAAARWMIVLLAAVVGVSATLVWIDKQTPRCFLDALAESFQRNASHLDVAYVENASSRDLEDRLTLLDRTLRDGTLTPARLLAIAAFLSLLAATAARSREVAVTLVLWAVAMCVVFAAQLWTARRLLRLGLPAHRIARRMVRYLTENPRGVQLMAVRQPVTDAWVTTTRPRPRHARLVALNDVLDVLDALVTAGAVASLGWLAVTVPDTSPTRPRAVVAAALALLAIWALREWFGAMRAVPEWRYRYRRLDDLLRAAAVAAESPHGVVEAETSMPPDAGGVVVAVGLAHRQTAAAAPRPTLPRLVLQPHDAVAIVGPTGSGKSAVAEMLLGVRPPASGAIWLAGKRLETYPPAERRQFISGVCGREPFLTETVAELLYLGNPGATSEMVTRACAVATVARSIDALPLGYATPLLECARLLSEGQRRLLLVARAIVVPPRVLVLDDVVDLLDPESARALLHSLRQIGAAVVVTTTSRDRVPGFRCVELDHHA